MDWTHEQRQAIEKSGENILLAAAAGSGKTAVLVQRIIEKICDPQSDINIDELLVLTFTDAAAREMREKIASAIEKVLEKDPENLHLQKQKLLLYSANISTIHSFCLNVLKSNIHLTGLPVNFSLVSETENKIMLSEALDCVLERFYGRIKKDKAISDLVMGYGGIKNDSTLRETVLSLFYFSKSMPNPSRWLSDAIRPYKEISKAKNLNSFATKTALDEILSGNKKSILGIYKDINREIDESLSPDHPYATFFAEEQASFERTFKHTENADYETVRRALFSFDFLRLASGRRNAEGEVLKAQEKIKALRDLAKLLMGELLELFKTDEAQLVKRISETYPRLRTLKNMVLMLDRRHIRMKRAKNYLDFSDLEHETLRLLTVGENSGDVTMRLRRKYKEILIDEYQDTNNIQDTLFRTISRDNRNIFMVGDMKQSIYTFRNAVPQLFSEKYESYETVGGGHLIRLFKNFRSRKCVVDTVNFVFRSIMSKAAGDVEYTHEEYLIQGARYPELKNKNSCDTEFHLVCSNPEDASDDESTYKTRLEAYIAADRILSMMAEGFEVYDKELDALRLVQFKDIVILMRNTKSAAPVFEEVFSQKGIPLYTEAGQGYLSAPEVQTVLAFLQIVDNPRQDIPLIAVMRSPIWGFSPDELAEIRTRKPKGDFYDAVRHSADSGDKKSGAFLEALELLRDMAEYRGVEAIIHSIYYEYGYYMYAGALSRGAVRQANLRLLFERAIEFEKTGLGGLFSFMNYIETIKSQGTDLTPAKTFGDDEDVVKIMTIHKSKGLEFPIVILADTARTFNAEDLRKNIIWNGETGLAADYVDTKLRVRYPVLLRDIVAAQGRQELISEEMRLLYVALTRAREKLIITATYKQTKKGLAMPLYNKDKCALPEYIRTRHCFRDWLIAAFLQHPDGEELRSLIGLGDEAAAHNADFNLKVVHYTKEAQVPTLEGTWAEAREETESTARAVDTDEIKSKILFRYEGDGDLDIPAKLSVSEVKRMQAEEEYVPILDELKIPEKLHTLGAIEGAEKGTVVHFFMQMADPRQMNSPQDAEALAKSLVEKNIFTLRQAEAIEPEKIYGFFASELGLRMKNAKRLEREFSFYTKAPASEIYLGSGAKGDILLQGIMDCFFVEKDGSVVLLDFKTDRVKNLEEAKCRAESYKVQMKYYKKALSEILEKPVSETWLYFLECGEAILMP